MHKIIIQVYLLISDLLSPHGQTNKLKLSQMMAVIQLGLLQAQPAPAQHHLLPLALQTACGTQQDLHRERWAGCSPEGEDLWFPLFRYPSCSYVLWRSSSCLGGERSRWLALMGNGSEREHQQVLLTQAQHWQGSSAVSYWANFRGSWPAQPTSIRPACPTPRWL